MIYLLMKRNWMKILITEEQLRWLIYEGKGNVLYYYRTKISLIDILETNRIRASSSATKAEIKFSKKRLFFVSTTRIKEYVFGGKGCRIYLDAEKLKQRYKIVPVSYFGGRQKYKVEHEERILMDDPYLVASDYITRIDVLIENERSYDYGVEILKLSKKINIPVYFFDNRYFYQQGDEKKSIELDFDSVSFNNRIVKYRVSEDDLILFFSIFYISQSDLYWFKHIDKEELGMKLKYFYEYKTQYEEAFLEVLKYMQGNKEYLPLLSFLGKTIRKSGSNSIYEFINKEYSKLIEMVNGGNIINDINLYSKNIINYGDVPNIIKSYILKGSVGDLSLNEKHVKTLGSLEKVKDGSLVLRWLNKLVDLGSLKEVDEELTIWNCPQLKSLGNLERVGGSLLLGKCNALNDLGSLKEVGGKIIIKQTPKLEELLKSGELEKLYPQFKGKFEI